MALLRRPPLTLLERGWLHCSCCSQSIARRSRSWWSCCAASVTVSLTSESKPGSAFESTPSAAWHRRAACWAAWQHYRRLYPLEQVCPAEGDRFYDHCQEGRFHYLVELDFECLGKDRARMMLQAIGRPDRLAIGDMWPVGRVPAWLTLADAKAIRDGPCLERLRPVSYTHLTLPTN